MFDYTPIVSGYIKSIEQLLHAICTSYRNSNNTQLDMSRFTLGSYIKYLKENTTIFRIDLQSELETIIDCLNRYRVESRDHLFQILDIDDVHYYIVIVNGKEYTGLHKVPGSE